MKKHLLASLLFLATVSQAAATPTYATLFHSIDSLSCNTPETAISPLRLTISSIPNLSGYQQAVLFQKLKGKAAEGSRPTITADFNRITRGLNSFEHTKLFVRRHSLAIGVTAAALLATAAIGGIIMYKKRLAAQRRNRSLLLKKNALVKPDIQKKIANLLSPEKKLTLPELTMLAPPRQIRPAILNSLTYGACGDALGNPVEFATKISAESSFTGFPGLTTIQKPADVKALSYSNHKPGQDCLVTDDTIMCEITFKVVAENKNKTDIEIVSLLANAYLQNYSHGAGYSWADRFRSPGTACLNAVTELTKITQAQKETSQHWWASAVGRTPGAEGGCGAIMRVAPIGWVFHNDITRAARLGGLQSLITHGDGCSIAASAAFAAAIAAGLQGYTVDQIISIAEQAARMFNGGESSERADWHASHFKTKNQLIADEIKSVTLNRFLSKEVLEEWYRTHGSFGAPGFLTGVLATAKHVRDTTPGYHLLAATLLPVNASQSKTVIDRDSLGSGVGQLLSVIEEITNKHMMISDSDPEAQASPSHAQFIERCQERVAQACPLIELSLKHPFVWPH